VQEVHGGLLQEAQQAQHAGRLSGVIDRCIIPLLGRKKVQDVKRPDIAGLMEKLSYKPTEANKAFSVLRKMFNLAEVWGYRPGRHQPCRHVPMFPPARKPGSSATRKWADLSASWTRWRPRGWRTTSSRWRSACNSSSPAAAPKSARSNGNGSTLENRRVVWPDSKTGGMSKPMSEEAYRLLSTAPRREGCPYVLPSPNTRQAPDHGEHYGGWSRALKAAGVPHVGTHGIRHRSATDIANSGVPVKVGMALTAHKTVAMFMRYVHTEDKPVREAAELVASRRKTITGRCASASTRCCTSARRCPKAGRDHRAGAGDPARCAAHVAGAGHARPVHSRLPGPAGYLAGRRLGSRDHPRNGSLPAGAGRGLSFVARQKRIPIDDEDFHLDLLFYNRKLRRLVAVELKIGEFKAAYKGQMELYLRWLDKHEREPEEASPLGIILCTGKKREQIELLELDKSGIHVAEYLTTLPPRAVLGSGCSRRPSGRACRSSSAHRTRSRPSSIRASWRAAVGFAGCTPRFAPNHSHPVCLPACA
jgi:hypothetical protein